MKCPRTPVYSRAVPKAAQFHLYELTSFVAGCSGAPLGDTSTRQSRLGSSWSAGFGFETSRAAIIPRKAMGKWVRWVASQGVARWVTRWEAR
jgi:hypothetical protein